MILSIVSSAQSCGSPPTVKNAQVQTSGETHLHNASYVCNAGLQLVGPKTLICLANGTWSLPAPTCEGMEGGMNMSYMVINIVIVFFLSSSES